MKKWLKYNWINLIVHCILFLSLIPILGLATDLTSTDIDFQERSIEAQVEAPENEADFDHHQEPHSPTERLVKTTGEWAIRLLVFSLLCTPLYILFGWRWPLPLRKPLGLYSFFYGILHFIFFLMDEAWNWLATFGEFNFILGLVALLIMLLLAITSNQWSMRSLGKKWKILHRLAYLAGVGAVLHLVLLGEGSMVLYGGLLAIGLLVRIPAVRGTIIHFRRHFRWNPLPA